MSQVCKVKQLLLSRMVISYRNVTTHFGPVLQNPNCSLTRLDLRGCSGLSHSGVLKSLLDSITINKSLTDLGLNIEEKTCMEELLDSGFHTRILTLRLLFFQTKEISDVWKMLILQSLTESGCAIKFLDCEIVCSKDSYDQSIWHSLIQSNSTTKLRALRICVIKLGSVSSYIVAGLAEYLRSSNLVHLEVRKYLGGALSKEFDDWECANSLINNFSICTLALPWLNDGAESFTRSLIHRNQLYRATKLLTEPQVKPNVAKLFLCGHAEVGKTTLCRALHMMELYPWKRSSLAAVFGHNRKPNRTRGMEFHSLSFRSNNKKLLICDLAGQEEYHVFHHYFMHASNNDFFIVVCKVDNSSTVADFEQQLDYWLKFIVSHRTPYNSRGLTSAKLDANYVDFKPKVIIVVNFFDQRIPLQAMNNITHEWTTNLMDRFSKVLDLAFDADNIGQCRNLFCINAKTTFGVNPLKLRLESLLQAFDITAWPIPKLCYDISAMLTKSSHKKGLYPSIFCTDNSESRLFTSYSEVLEMLQEGGYADIQFTRVEAALRELHNQGYVIFFPSQKMDEEDYKSQKEFSCKDNIMSTLVITDINWFCNKLVGSLLGTHLQGEPRRSHPSLWSKGDIKIMLRRQGCREKHLEEILRYLQQLELCVSLDTNLGHRKDNLLLFPALVKEKKIQYPNVECKVCNIRSSHFFGRRLKCLDSSIHLIPFGIFTRLQLKLHMEYCANNRSFNLGYGWTSFMKGNVGVVVRFGGDLFYEAWESKQWIDILIFCPGSCRFHVPSPSSTIITAGHHDINPMDDPSFIAGNKVMDKIKDLIYATCKAPEFGGIPTVKLEELVLESKELGSQAIPLSDIMERVRKEGLQESHQELALDRGFIPVMNLLLPKEIEDHVKGQFNILADIEEEFSLCAPQGDGEGGGQESELESHHMSGKQLTSELQELYERITIEVRSFESRQEKRLERMTSTLQMIRKDVQKLGDALRQAEWDIIASCSTRLLRHELAKDRAYPLYPYLVDAAGKLAPLKALFGKRTVVHFMCESPTEGPHPVALQKGKEVTMEAKEWVAKTARVMVPAVRLLCCLARVAASVYLPSAQVFVPSPEALVNGLGIQKDALQHVILPKALEALLQHLPDVDYRHFLTEDGSMLKREEVKEVIQEILKNVEVDMASNFGLYRVHFDDIAGDTFWVCDDHVGKGKRLRPIQNPFQ